MSKLTNYKNHQKRTIHQLMEDILLWLDETNRKIDSKIDSMDRENHI